MLAAADLGIHQLAVLDPSLVDCIARCCLDKMVTAKVRLAHLRQLIKVKEAKVAVLVRYMEEEEEDEEEEVMEERLGQLWLLYRRCTFCQEIFWEDRFGQCPNCFGEEGCFGKGMAKGKGKGFSKAKGDNHKGKDLGIKGCFGKSFGKGKGKA